MLLNIAIIVNVILLGVYLIYNLKGVTENPKVCTILLLMGIICIPTNFMVTMLDIAYAIIIYMASFNNKISIGIPIGLTIFLSIIFIGVVFLFTREVNFRYIFTLLLALPSILIVYMESKYVIYEEKGVIGNDSKNSKS